MTRLQIALVSLVLVTFLCSISLVAPQRIRYDHYHVYELKPDNIEQLVILEELEGISRDAYIFLDEIHFPGPPINVLVSPQMVSYFLLTMKHAGVTHRLVDDNAQQTMDEIETDVDIDDDTDVADVANPFSIEYTWKVYHTLNSTYSWLRSLSMRYPEQVSVFVAGKSYEGRDILGVKISYGAGRRAIFVEGGMHAREWISPATVTYIAHQLLTSENKEVRLIAESFDWYIVPHANPDGNVYTHTKDRLWRKTRTPYGKGCYGADPNRNWDFHWKEKGASSKPCSETYAGPAPFSEVETRTLAEFIATLKGKVELYLSFHSYSQLLLFPYGHTAKLPPNYDELKRVFDAAIAGIKRRYGTKYTGGNIYDAIYPASGSSTDWAYARHDVKYAYTYELRPSRNEIWFRFKLPAQQIIPTGEETLDSLVEMIKAIGIKRFP